MGAQLDCNSRGCAVRCKGNKFLDYLGIELSLFATVVDELLFDVFWHLGLARLAFFFFDFFLVFLSGSLAPWFHIHIDSE